MIFILYFRDLCYAISVRCMWKVKNGFQTVTSDRGPPEANRKSWKYRKYEKTDWINNVSIKIHLFLIKHKYCFIRRLTQKNLLDVRRGCCRYKN